MANIRIMSNNQWKCDVSNAAWEALGLDCSAEVRGAGLARMILETKPDILGLQECSALMADVQLQTLAEGGMQYALLWGRDTPILYRPDKFELLDTAWRIYPLALPGYEGEFNNSKTKSYCIGVFRAKENGRVFIFATTHLWWKSTRPESEHYQPHSDLARAYQVGLLMDELTKLQETYHCPAIFCGDLNAGIGSKALDAIFARGFLHAHDIATDFADPYNGHHPCGNGGFKPYVPTSYEKALDHILLRGDGVTIRRYERFAEDWYMPLSDHLPVWIDCEI